MMIISMAWTTQAVIARIKTCTRRDWKPRMVARHKKGVLLQVCDKVLFAGGHKIDGLVIELTADAVQEHISTMPDSDYKAEGFAHLDSIAHPLPEHWAKAGCKNWREAFDLWRSTDAVYTVVRFCYPKIKNTLSWPFAR